MFVAYGVALGFSAAGLSRLVIDYSPEQFLLLEGEDRAVFEDFKEEFLREDLQVSALVEIAGAFGIDDFRALERVATAFTDAGLESVRWVGSTDLPEEILEDGEPAILFVRLEDEAELTSERIGELVEARRDRAPWAGFLWNRDLSVFVVHGYLRPEDNTDVLRRTLLLDLEASLSTVSGPSRVVLTGLPKLRSIIPMALEKDLVRLLGLGLIVSFVILFLFLRRLRLVLVCLGAVVPAVLLTFGAIGWSGLSLSVLSILMPIVVVVVGVSDAIHLVVATRRGWASGLDGPRGVRAAFGALARACFFTSVTTALGFAGLTATRIGIISDFGLVTALAVSVTFVVSMTLLPALLVGAADSVEPTKTTRVEGAIAPWLRHVSRIVEERSVALCFVVAGLCLAGLGLGSRLTVEVFLVDDMKADDPIVEELRWVEDQGFGVFQVNVFLNDMGSEGHAPAMLDWIEDLEAYVVADSVVVGSLGLPSFVRELGEIFDVHPELAGDAFWSAWTSSDVRELLFLAEIQGEGTVDEVYHRESGTGQLLLFVIDAGATRMEEFFHRLDDRLATAPPPFGEVHVTGTVKLTQALWEQLISRFLPSLLLSLGLVWLALTAMFRSIRVGTIALLPNLMPLAMLAGLMQISGFHLKASTIIVFAIAFGIVADDTIHFLAALRSQLSDGADLRSATRTAIMEVGPALIVTTLVVVGGFTVLTAARFRVVVLMGVLTSSAALFALFVDLVGFPALLFTLSRYPTIRRIFERNDP